MTAAQATASTHLQNSICVMRKYGFRIARENMPGDDLQQDALNTACLMLGLEATDDNKRSVAVADLAKVLSQNI